METFFGRLLNLLTFVLRHTCSLNVTSGMLTTLKNFWALEFGLHVAKGTTILIGE